MTDSGRGSELRRCRRTYVAELAGHGAAAGVDLARFGEQGRVAVAARGLYDAGHGLQLGGHEEILTHARAQLPQLPAPKDHHFARLCGIDGASERRCFKFHKRKGAVRGDGMY